jgi:hypothetical protein
MIKRMGRGYLCAKMVPTIKENGEMIWHKATDSMKQLIPNINIQDNG